MMTREILAKALLVWVGILALAVANGLLREAVLVSWLGQVTALFASGVLLSLVIVGVAYVALPWIATRRVGQLVAIGGVWLLLTLVFEFSFGLAQGKSLSLLLDAYTFTGGNIWPVVLLVTVCAPYLAARLRGWA